MSYLKTLEVYHISIQTILELPFSKDGISAGFPSPADDFLDAGIDLNKELIKNPSATFYGKVRGHSMKDLGIHDGDLLVIDRSLEVQNGKIAVCFVDGEFTVKQIQLGKNTCWLLPANKDFKPMQVTPDNDFQIWGIVIHVIKNF
jgi:DNA polymerase V